MVLGNYAFCQGCNLWKIKIQIHGNCWNTVFDTLVLSNIDFTENLSGGKILEFQHWTKTWNHHFSVKSTILLKSWFHAIFFSVILFYNTFPQLWGEALIVVFTNYFSLLRPHERKFLVFSHYTLGKGKLQINVIEGNWFKNPFDIKFWKLLQCRSFVFVSEKRRFLLNQQCAHIPFLMWKAIFRVTAIAGHFSAIDIMCSL